MEDLIHYFNTIPTLHRTFFLVGGLTFLLSLEIGVPLFRFDYRKSKHLMTNLFYTLTTLIINLLGAALILLAADFNE